MDTNTIPSTKTRLAKCNFSKCTKTLQLFNLPCMCKKTFCIKHRLPEVHMCSFDYKTHGKQILEKNIIQCHSNKIIKI
jgi:predicted nucleic acid binding AN1-type Zn finger protein